MGTLTLQKPVKLVCSVIYRKEEALKAAEEELLAVFGTAEPAEKVLAFDYTDYYWAEMGKPLVRKLICFRELAPAEDVHKAKLATNAMEERLAEDGKRTVNIDPGYLTEAKLVLLTTKDYNHRIYVGDRIFAEPTLFYRDGAFCAWPWTYPDYASPAMKEYFEAVRDIYMGQRAKNITLM